METPMKQKLWIKVKRQEILQWKDTCKEDVFNSYKLPYLFSEQMITFLGLASLFSDQAKKKKIAQKY